MTQEQQPTADERTNSAKKYWDDLARRGGWTPHQQKKNQYPYMTKFLSTQQAMQAEDITVIVGLRQDLATAQKTTLRAIAEAAALKTKITELEVQPDIQTRAWKTVQERLRAARWRWTLGGFLGGCLVTMGVIEAFMIHFLSP